MRYFWLKKISVFNGLQGVKSRGMVLFEWAVALLGIAGVAWIALNIPSSKYGWLLAITTPIMFVIIARQKRMWPLAINQALLVVINIVGIWRWVL